MSIITQGELDEFEQLYIESPVEWTIHKNFKLEKVLTEKFNKDLYKKKYGNGQANLERPEKTFEFSGPKLGLNLNSYWTTLNIG